MVTGGLMIGWSLIIIPVNLAADGNGLDLWFGLVLLISGAILARSGWQRARETARQETRETAGQETRQTARPETRENAHQETGSVERAAQSLFLSVAGGLITGLLQKLFGI